METPNKSPPRAQGPINSSSPTKAANMAVMDTFEREGDGHAATQKEGIKQAEPPSSTGKTTSGPPYTSVAAEAAAPSGAAIATIAKKNRPYSVGPSPEKGSGQDRFRQMIKGTKPASSVSAYEDLDAPKSGDLAFLNLPSSFSGAALKKNDRHAGGRSHESNSQDRLRQMMADVSGFATNGMPSSSGSFETSGTYMPYEGHMGMGGSHFSPVPYCSGMVSQAQDLDHRVAINPAMFPGYGIDASRSSSLPPTNAGGKTNGAHGGNDTNGANGSNTSNGGRDRGQNQNQNPSQNRTAGATGSDYKPTWTSILSAECQKRRFNPQFTEWITQEGAYKASVNLNGQILHDSRHFQNPADAKQALAKKAVEHVRSLKVPNASQPNRAADKARYEQQRMDQEQQKKKMGGDRVARPPVKMEAGYDRYPGSSTNRPEPVRNHYPGASTTRPEPARDLYSGPSAAKLEPARDHYPGSSTTRPEQARDLYLGPSAAKLESARDHYPGEEGAGTGDQDRRLLERIQSMYGRSAAGDRILADPVAARAFLEGFALGGRLRETAYRSDRGDGEREQRRSRSPRYERREGAQRERSPFTATNYRHRERSPLPSRRRVSFDDFPQYMD